MEILKPDIKWEGKLQPLNLPKVDSIALHHMAHPTWNFWDVHRYHTYTNNWIGIGYNYWIAFDGTIYMGRGFNKGAAVGDNNSHIISIGFQGDYERVNKEMPKEQYAAGVWLIRYIRDLVPTIKIVDGHKRWNKTACPGKYFPLKQMSEEGMKEEEEEEMRFNKIEEIPDYAKDTIQKLVDKGILKGNEKGLDLSEDMIRMIVLNDRAGLYDNL